MLKGNWGSVIFWTGIIFFITMFCLIVLFCDDINLWAQLYVWKQVKMEHIFYIVPICVNRNSAEESMELSEEERSELMKKESSRLLKTGHRISYSPRKEKALKIYLDGGPSKDPGHDWYPSTASGFMNHLAAAAERVGYTNSECKAWHLLEHGAALWAPGLAQETYCALEHIEL